MNLISKQERLYLNRIKNSDGSDRILTSVQINGGKNLDGTFKPSGFLKARLTKEQEANLFEYLKTLTAMPKWLLISGEGFLSYEEWKDSNSVVHKDFVAVIQKAEILGSEATAEENAKNKLPF